MKKLTRLMALSCAVLVVACLTTASATTYYLSPSGSDSNNGTSTSTPWQTVAKVNATTFNGGDSLLLQGGQTFTGSFTFVRSKVLSSGTSHFTVGAYGTGNPTIVSTGTGSNSSAILVQGVSGIVLQDLIVRPGATSPQAGIYICNNSGGTPAPQDITVQRCDVGGFHYAPTGFGAEIFANGYWGSLTSVKILNNVLHGLSGASSPDDNGFSSLGNGKNIFSLTVQGNTVYNIGGTAGTLGGSIGNGILANGVDGGVLQYNIVHDCGGNTTTCGGPGGIWAYSSNNITIQFNEVYKMNPVSYTAGCDWAAYDLDGMTTNSVVQYNYSHDNFGPAMLAYVAGTWGPNTFRYNISENDDFGNGNGGPITIGGPAVTGVLQIYNNTIYDSSDQSTTNGHSPVYGPYTSGTWAAGSMIKNNIFYVTNKNKYGNVTLNYFPYLPQANLTFDNNVYYVTQAAPSWRWGSTNYTTFASYQTGTGFDTHSLTSNPQLVAPGTGGTLTWNPTLANGPQPNPTGYELQGASPLFGAGANLGSINPGTRDYFNYATPNGVGSGYNIGADGGGPGNSGPVGYWNLNEGSGTAAADASGNGVNGTLVNSPAWVAGMLSNALSFNGTNSYVNMNNASATGPLKPASLPVTISGWIKTTGTVGMVFASDEWDNSKYAGYCLQLVGGKLVCNFGNAATGIGSANRQSKTGTTVLTAGQWYHVAAVIQGASNMQIYLNGVDDGGAYSGSAGAMAYTTTTSKIGSGGNANYFNGVIDDVRIYNRALSATEIGLLKNGPVSNWRLDESSGSTAIDSGTAGITGTLVNSPTVTTGWFSNALNFNGSTSYINMNNASMTGPLKPALPVTISGWIQMSGTTAGTIFASDEWDTAKYAGCSLQVIGTHLVCNYGDAGGAGPANRQSKTGTTVLTVGQWYHVAAVIQGPTTMTLYVNGVDDGGSYSGSASTVVYTTATTKIGTGGNANYFNGIIDDVRVYSRALSAAEISALAGAASGVIPPE